MIFEIFVQPSVNVDTKFHSVRIMTHDIRRKKRKKLGDL